MTLFTENLPISVELNQKLFDSCRVKTCYPIQLNIVVKLLDLLNKDNSNEPFTYISIHNIPTQRLIDCLQSVENSSTQVNLLYIINKLSSLEECNNLTICKKFTQISNKIIYNNSLIRNTIYIGDMDIVNWDEIMIISDTYLFNSDKLSIYDPKHYMELNKIIISAMVSTMPILRAVEYVDILLDKDDNNICNYIQRNENLDKWELIIDTKKADINLKRTIPIHRSVVDLLIKYDIKLRKPVNISQSNRDTIYMFNKNLSHLYLFKSSIGKIPLYSTFDHMIKELYGYNITTEKLRALSAIHFKNQINTTIDMRMQLAKYMGHTFNIHVKKYGAS